MTYTEALLQYLKENGSITADVARQELNIKGKSLSSLINNLISRGEPIERVPLPCGDKRHKNMKKYVYTGQLELAESPGFGRVEETLNEILNELRKLNEQAQKPKRGLFWR